MTTEPPENHAPADVFATTHWTVVVAAGQQHTSQSVHALEQLCRTYWPPLYAFVRRQGHAPHDAQDLTQEFFARVLEKNYVHAADREKGRFRTFLIMALKRFLANEWDKARARKRGGGRVLQPLDTNLAEQCYQSEQSHSLPADAIYERRWAVTMLERTLSRLKEEFVAQEKLVEFEHLKKFLTADRGEVPYTEVAGSMGMSEGAVRVAVHRLRRRFRELFREEVAQTVATPEDIDDELRHLLKALGA